MRVYELVLVTKATVGEADSKKLIDNIQKWLGDAKIEVDKLGKKVLAYPIKKEREGIYLALKITYDNGTVIPLDFEKKLYMVNEVLRHLLILRSERSSSPPLKKERRKSVSKKS